MAAVKVNVTFDEQLLTRIDAYADENGMTRSGFLGVAAKQYIDAVEMMPTAKKLMMSLAALAHKTAGGEISKEEAAAEMEDLELAYKSILGKK